MRTWTRVLKERHINAVDLCLYNSDLTRTLVPQDTEGYRIPTQVFE